MESAPSVSRAPSEKGAARARRPYSSERRRTQAAETRAAVLAAATEIFSDRGWVGTGMRDVARQAGVAVETVYAGFGSKADLLQAALDAAVVGDDQPLALAERPAFRLLGVGTLEERARAAAALVTAINRRTSGLGRALREAARTDEDLQGRLTTNEQRRRTNVQQAAELVADRRIAATEQDGLWAVLGIEPYLLLVEQAGWSDERYEQWAADLIVRLLREDERPH